MSVITCPKCKNEISSEVKFCPVCGSPVENLQNNISMDKKSLKKKKRRRNFIIFIAVIATIIGISKVSSMMKERIKWSDIVLGEILPTPPSSRGNLMTNSSERLYVSLKDVSPKEYAAFVNNCAEKGFTTETEKDDDSYNAFNSDGVRLSLSYYNYNEELDITLDMPEEMSQISWPDSAAGKKLPKPESLIGKFSYEHDDSFFVYISETDKDTYKKYVKACSDKGFNVDYDKGDDYYRANDSEGWRISLEYQGNNVMSIDIDAPDEKETKKPEETTQAEKTTKAEVAEKATTEKQSEKENTSVSPEFKNTMDEYEAFINEYVDFINEYTENSSDLKLIAKYAEIMAKYSDYCDEIDDIDEDELSDSDLSYYLEVMSRVTKKIAEIE